MSPEQALDIVNTVCGVALLNATDRQNTNEAIQTLAIFVGQNRGDSAASVVPKSPEAESPTEEISGEGDKAPEPAGDQSSETKIPVTEPSA